MKIRLNVTDIASIDEDTAVEMRKVNARTHRKFQESHVAKPDRWIGGTPLSELYASQEEE